MKAALGLLLMSGVALAAPKPISIKLQDAPLFDLARQLSDQSGCRVSAFGIDKLSFTAANLSLWEVLARLEAEHGIRTVFQRGGGISLEPRSSPPRSSFNVLEPTPTWLRHWRSSPEWAVALLGDATPSRARLIVLGFDNASLDKVVIDKATAGGKSITVAAGSPVTLTACEPGVVTLDLSTPAGKLTLRGHAVVKVPKVIEKRVQVPLDDRVVDLAGGRLRIHVASMAGSGSRTVMVNWDGMGVPVRVTTELVDDTGAPISASGRGSAFSSSGQASQSWTVSSSAKVTAILRIPSTQTTDQKVPFRFDNEPLDKP
jgi:hypothetical protein